MHCLLGLIFTFGSSQPRIGHEVSLPPFRADPSMIMGKFLLLVTRTLSTIIPGICICICIYMIQKLHLQGHLVFVTMLRIKATESEFSFFVNCEIVSLAEDAGVKIEYE